MRDLANVSLVVLGVAAAAIVVDLLIGASPGNESEPRARLGISLGPSGARVLVAGRL